MFYPFSLAKRKKKMNAFDLRFYVSAVVQSNHMVTIDFEETSHVSKKSFADL